MNNLRKQKNNKTQKGITLIALIITIIVMLILVGVSVSIALNNGLFKATQGAAKNTELAKSKEQELSSGKVTIIQDDGITKKELNIFDYAVTGVDSSSKEPKVGDYVKINSSDSGDKWRITEINNENITIAAVFYDSLSLSTELGSGKKYSDYDAYIAKLLEGTGFTSGDFMTVYDYFYCLTGKKFKLDSSAHDIYSNSKYDSAEIATKEEVEDLLRLDIRYQDGYPYDESRIW